MRSPVFAPHRVSPLVAAAAALALFVAAPAARAQLTVDGNVLFNNNASGTLAGQFTGTTSTGPLCVGKTPAQIGTVDFVNNLYADPFLTGALYPTTNPNWRPGPGSIAAHHAVVVPDPWFDQTCFAGAVPPLPDPDWTQGWTYYDSLGTGRDDLHLPGMTAPRPEAVYQNITIGTGATRTFTADSNYLVRGQLRVLSGGTLRINAGVVVRQDRATVGTIRVDRGGKIFATGTATQPVVITGNDPVGAQTRGCGGGLVINGYARVNVVNSCAGDSIASEGGALGFYGGNDDNDDSGVLEYVRVEYAGREITPNNELNSFTFNGVGRGTTVNHIQAHRGADDGIEEFGGTVEMKYCIATDGTDDGFDWQLGYRGRAQYVIARTSAEFAPSGTQNGDKGIEADNNEFNFDASLCAGYSNPTIANFTLIGEKRQGPSYPGSGSGVNLRRGTAGTVINSIVYNYKSNAFSIQDNATLQHHCAAIPAAPALYCGGNVTGVPVASGRVFVTQSAPNPFRNDVRFRFTLPKAGPVRVEVFAADGRKVATVSDQSMPAGDHSVSWTVGRRLPSGMYFYKVVAGGEESTGKMVRID